MAFGGKKRSAMDAHLLGLQYFSSDLILDIISARQIVKFVKKTLRFQTTKWTQNIHYFQIQCRVYKAKEDGRWKIKIRIRKKEIEAG